MVVNDELMAWNEAVETNFKVLFQHFPHVTSPHPPPKKHQILKTASRILTEFVNILTVKE